MKWLAVFILAIFLLGCNQTDTGGSKDINFRTGTGGLSASFMPNSPPNKVFLNPTKQNIVVLGVELHNKGAEEASQGILVLGGYDPNIISWPTHQSIPNIAAKDVFNPDGGREFIELNGAVNLESMGENYKPTILATTCYRYETQADIPLCIDSDPFNGRPKACKSGSTSVSGGQGGPLGITNVAMDASKGQTLLQISIKNQGDGDPFWTSGGTSKCLPESGGIDERQEVGLILIGKVQIGGDDITSTCRGIGLSSVRLNKGSATIFCSYTTNPGEDAYKTILSIDLGYLYRTTTTKTIELVKTP